MNSIHETVKRQIQSRAEAERWGRRLANRMGPNGHEIQVYENHDTQTTVMHKGRELLIHHKPKS